MPQDEVVSTRLTESSKFREALTGFSHVSRPDGLHDAFLKAASSKWLLVQEQHIPRTGVR